jgi:hypothetical protein
MLLAGWRAGGPAEAASGERNRTEASGEQEHGSQTREQGGPFQVANVIASCWPGHAPDVSGRAVAHSATVP